VKNGLGWRVSIFIQINLVVSLISNEKQGHWCYEHRGLIIKFGYVYLYVNRCTWCVHLLIF